MDFLACLAFNKINKTLVMVLGLFFIINIIGTEAILFSGTAKTSSRLVYITRFGFQSGGVAKVGLSAQPAGFPFAILGCTVDQTRNMNSLTMDELCKLIETFKVPCAFSFSTQSFGLSRESTAGYNISQSGRYYFYLSNCAGIYSEVRVRMELINRNGNQLSTEFISMPTVSLVILCLSIVLGLLVLINWFYYRSQVSVLHRLICVYPLFKILFCAVGLFYWNHFKRYGYSPKVLTAGYLISYVSTELCLFIIIVLASACWGICSEINAEVWPMWVSLSIALITLVLGSLIHTFFSIFAFLAWIIVLGMSFRSASANHRIVNQNILEPDHDPIVDNLAFTLKSYKFTLALYIGLVAAVILVNVIFLIYLQWVAQLLLDILGISFFAIIAFLFRLRSDSSYYKLKPEVMMRNSMAQFTDRDEASLAKAYNAAITVKQQQDDDELVDIPLGHTNRVSIQNSDSLDDDDHDDGDHNNNNQQHGFTQANRPNRKRFRVSQFNDDELEADATFNPPSDEEQM